MFGTGSPTALRSLLFEDATPPGPAALAFARSLRAKWLVLLRSAQWLAPRRIHLRSCAFGENCGCPHRIGAAEEELSGLVRREFARLLRHGVLLRAESQGGRSPGALRLDVLRCALEDELAFAARTGRRPRAAFGRLFEACLQSTSDAWPDALVFALAAVALEDCQLGRRLLLEAVARRDPRCAESLDLDKLLARPLCRSHARSPARANAGPYAGQLPGSHA